MSTFSSLPPDSLITDDRPEASAELRFWMHWEENESFLLRLCQGWIGGDAAEARELLSSAMLRAWEGALKSGDEIGNYRAWLARIVRHHCIDAQRRQSRDPQVKTDPEMLAPIAEMVRGTHQSSPEIAFLKEESYAELLGRMEGLPERLREVMMLRAYQNMSYKEIGQHLQISTENARKRVQMARSLLKGQPVEQMDIGVGDEAPVSEREATEAILTQDRSAIDLGFKFADPVDFKVAALLVEVPILLETRPIRLAQKVETLRRYLERHPGGWKKELELARLLWAMGDATEAIERFLAAFGRHPQHAEVAISCLRALHALGAWDQMGMIAQEATLHCPSGQLQALYKGYAALAAGDASAAMAFWKSCPTIGGAVQAARICLAQGDKSAARELLLQQIQGFPMDREAFLWFSVAAAGTPDGLAQATLAHRRFPGDPYAAASLLVETLRQGTAVPKAAITEAARLAPSSFLMAALKVAWAKHQKMDARMAETCKEFLEAQPGHVQGLAMAQRLIPTLKPAAANALRAVVAELGGTAPVLSTAQEASFLVAHPALSLLD